MKGYWKIPKEWISEWGLTASECIVLADILSGWECTVKERAKRCGIDRRQLLNIRRSIWEKISQNDGKKFPIEWEKISQKMGKNFPKNGKKFPIPPHTPSYKEKKHEEQEERENNAHTLEDFSNLEKIEKIAAEFREEVAGATEIAERLERLFGLPRAQLAEAADVFRDTLLAQGDEYKSRGDYRRHFTSWLKINAKRIFNEPKPNNNARDNADYIGGLLDKLRTSGIG